MEYMEKQIQKFIDRWFLKQMESEEDVYEFEYKWYNCLILRINWHLNGYVECPPMDDETTYTFDVHWWITYQWRIEYNGKTYFANGIWFDTAHYKDCYYDKKSQYCYCPDSWYYKNKDYVIKELHSLVDQF